MTLNHLLLFGRALTGLALICLSAAALFAQGGAAGKPADADWTPLRAAYDYPRKSPVPDVVEKPKASPDAYQLHLTFTGPNGEKVPGVFLRPKAEGVYPCVLVLHGLTSSKDDSLQYFGKPFIEKGMAILALDAPHHGERRVPNENQWTPAVISVAVHEGVRDYRRALDYLATRKDVDSKRIGLFGYSMGSIMGSILGGVDSRVSSFALCVGGDPFVSNLSMFPETQRQATRAVCPSLYVGHIAPRPLLMLNGRQDTTVVKAATDLLYKAAGDPKQIRWFDSGHILPGEAVGEGIAWLADKLHAGR